MTTLAQNDTLLNTSPVGNTKRSRCRNYCFTWNNYEKKDIDYIINLYHGTETQYIFQEEIGTNNTPHLQGLILYKNPMDFNSIKKILCQCHIEKCKSKKASIAYCSKPDTRNGEVYTNIPNIKILPPRKKLKDPLNGYELYDYQKEILNRIKLEPDDRTIYWYWDKKGNKGKSALSKHICMKYNSIILCGKSNDIKYAIATYLETKDLDIVIFDFTRTMEDYIPYQALEEIKNGCFFCGKYESKQIIFNPPHVICFANFLPQIEKLSIDRWYIKNIETGSIHKNIEDPLRVMINE